jgi:hypothetical protein
MGREDKGREGKKEMDGREGRGETKEGWGRKEGKEREDADFPLLELLIPPSARGE